MQPNPAQSSNVPGRNEASPRSEQSRNPLSSGLAIVAFLAGIAIAGFDIKNGDSHQLPIFPALPALPSRPISLALIDAASAPLAPGLSIELGTHQHGRGGVGISKLRLSRRSSAQHAPSGMPRPGSPPKLQRLGSRARATAE